MLFFYNDGPFSFHLFSHWRGCHISFLRQPSLVASFILLPFYQESLSFLQLRSKNFIYQRRVRLSFCCFHNLSDKESFCFVSVEGHMFGGMITFSAHQEEGPTVAQVQALLRASDPFFEVIVRSGLGTKAEDEFWHGTLKNLAAHFGVTGQPVSQRVVLLDPGVQWANAKNIWYNAAIRTALYMPVRWLRSLGTR